MTDITDVEAKRQELQALLEGEGFAPEVASATSFEWLRRETEERVNGMIDTMRKAAADRPPRNEEMPGVIDFERAKDRRLEREIDEDEEASEAVRQRLAELLLAMPGDPTMVCLRALLDVLEAGGLSRSEAKAKVALYLSAFQEGP